MAAKTPDRRVQRTRQLLKTALMSLIQEKGFEALSVQDIIDRANVGRATFYTHFDNKEDLLRSGIEGLRLSLRECQRQALSQTPRTEARMFAFSREMFTHANEHRDVFRAMIGKRSGSVIQQLFHRMLVALVREDIKALSPRNDSGSAPMEAVVQYIAGGLFGVVIWWVDGRMRLSVEEVERRLAIPALKAALR